jgi:uncharacterized protein (TIGR03437 family)
LWLAASCHAQVNVLTANNDNQRTSANLQETTLTLATVNAGNFGKLGFFPVDGQIYAQPLYASGIQIAGHGPRNVVFVVTMRNSVYAIDADDPNSTDPLWKINFGSSVTSSVLNFNDIMPEVGILSTPVIDINAQVMYVVSDTLENDTPVLRLHALALADGHEMFDGPVAIAATVNGNGAGSQAGKLVFDPAIHLQRVGLVLSKGLVYLGFGSRADMNNWHGWLMSYDASTLKQVSAITTTADGYGGAVWQSGRAPNVDENGDLYVVTGNGNYDGSVNFSDSVLKLSGTDLTLMDYFTPSNFDYLKDNDLDLGSAGAILVPGTKEILAIGKTGNLFLIQSDAMGHLGAETTGAVQNVQANQRGTFAMALWNRPSGPIIYTHELGGPLSAYKVVNGKIGSSPLSQTVTNSGPTVFAGVSVSGDSQSPDSAIVWYATANYNFTQQPGTLHAFDASDLTHELWNSDLVPTDRLGRFAKMTTLTVANGKVFVPTFSDQLAIYGLFGTGTTVTAAGPPVITAVARSTDFLAGPIAPGELVTIFGANLGPTLGVSAQFDATGHLPRLLSGSKVFIGGKAAPLLYSTANQIGAIVPFGITGTTTPVQVQNGSAYSAPVDVPVAAASPAVFSMDGTGGRIGAIINQDGTLNTFSHPAPKGSVVTMYATGVGQTNPGGVDGQISGAGSLPVPLLPVTATIDNKAADVLYAGAAPGMVAGVIQLNLRIPSTASSGQDQITVTAGTIAGPNTVTVIVQ